MGEVIATAGYMLESDEPLTHARILWGTLGRDATWTATSEEEDFEAQSLASEATSRRWRATSNSATVTANLSGSHTINGIGIAAHNLVGATVTVSVGSTQVAQFSVTDPEALLVLFESVTASTVSVAISHDTPPEIGALFIGDVLEMQRPIYGGHSPITLSGDVTRFPSQSESGQFLPRKIIRRGYSTSIQWQNLSADWYRQNFAPFAEYAREVGPFFLAWRPVEYPSEVAYCWSNDDIQPSNQGQRDLMQVGMNLEAFRE